VNLNVKLLLALYGLATQRQIYLHEISCFVCDRKVVSKKSVLCRCGETVQVQCHDVWYLEEQRWELKTTAVRNDSMDRQTDLDALECINSLTSNVTFLGDKQNFWKM